MVLDTHPAMGELQAAGFTEAQAEAVVRAILRARGPGPPPLATSAGIQVRRAGTEAAPAPDRADAAHRRALRMQWLVAAALALQLVALPGTVVLLAP